MLKEMWFFMLSPNNKKEKERLQRPVPAARSTPPKTGCETVWLVSSVWSIDCPLYDTHDKRNGSQVSIRLTPQRTACSGAARRSSGTPARLRYKAVHIWPRLSHHISLYRIVCLYHVFIIQDSRTTRQFQTESLPPNTNPPKIINTSGSFYY